MMIISRNVWPEKIPFVFIHEHSSIPCTGHHVIHFLFYQIHSTSFDQNAIYLSELIQIDPKWVQTRNWAVQSLNPFDRLLSFTQHPFSHFKNSNKDFGPKYSSSGTSSLWNSNFGSTERNGMNLNKLGNDDFKTCELGPLLRLTFSDL